MSIKSKSILLVIILLIIDQWSKIYVKTHFVLGESVDVLSWFKITFIENEGAAFGMKVIGKLFLTLFRIAAIAVLIVFISKLIKRQARTGYILVISLLLAGAVGNLIDSLFYGMFFTQSTSASVAQFLPHGGGYAPFLYGHVVDMFYFPIITSNSGEVLFFKWIFNVADSCVTVSVILILLFFRNDLNKSLDNKEKKEISYDKE
ncbi:MAG: lipoprotein signal peptidase [Paludibacteraceae bacterium]